MARKKTAKQNPSRARSNKKSASRKSKPAAPKSKPATSKSKSKNSAKQKTGLIRLQRVMASAGIGSRRECEIIIQEGRVEVDGEVVVELGTKVDIEKQAVYVDSELLVQEKLQYFMLNKPPGIVSTSNDPSGRVRVIDLIKTDRRVYNVGRLDQSSEGLILVTNDGELANKLTHPRYGVEKKYHVQVAGTPSPNELRALERGVYLAEGKAKATSARFLRKVKNSSWIEIVLAEGRNREIRRMLSSIDHKVRKLKRVSIGPLKMGDLPVGAHRELTVQELRQLRRAADGEFKTKRKKAAWKNSKDKAPKDIKSLKEKSADEKAAAQKKSGRRKLADDSESKDARKKKVGSRKKSGAGSSKRNSTSTAGKRKTKSGGKKRATKKAGKRGAAKNAKPKKSARAKMAKSKRGKRPKR